MKNNWSSGIRAWGSEGDSVMIKYIRKMKNIFMDLFIPIPCSSLNSEHQALNSCFKTLNPKPRTSSSFFNDPRSVFPFLLCVILLFSAPVFSQSQNYGIKYPEIKTLILENRFDAAQKLLDASAGTETGSASLELYQTEIWIGRANSLYESGKKKSAFEYYELAYQKWPNHPTVYQRYNELRGRSLSDLSVRNTAGHYGAGNAVSISEKAYDRRAADSAVQPERRTEKEDTFLFAWFLVLSALVLSLLATNISLLIILARQEKK
ncbi:MAG TPA: tetratricopeptide repeat protein [Leptospiraceae bacterium]|nr:tetratricopeptide repeat protein [Leptospiraceae bacterium]HNF16311.1 tetratricopeptide repeat protein [Leptospiraceae bacterium]HNF25960.1 tetratricopeptide repeat protein [Leptospiraceae bacterium]HNM03116.1 tetratricopeptide repeat protein [Leptospiraceae bacterium]HNN04250.1 tetratricopeptide repeat protein [Leptospiraceae bacterium]